MLINGVLGFWGFGVLGGTQVFQRGYSDESITNKIHFFKFD